MSNIPFSANSILILKLKEFKNLPRCPLKTGSLMSSCMWAIVDLWGVGGGLEGGRGELTGVD